jgi:hypothetical protein
MGTRVAITLSDPWDLVTACGAGPFMGTVLDVVSRSILVELDKPLNYGGQRHEFALCQLRHEGTTVGDLLSTRDSPTGIGFFVRSTLPKAQVVAAQSQKGVGALGTIRKLS